MLPQAWCQPAVRATGTGMRRDDPSSTSADTERYACVAGQGTRVAKPASGGAGEAVGRSALRRAPGPEARAGRGTSPGRESESSGARGPTEGCGHHLERIQLTAAGTSPGAVEEDEAFLFHPSSLG